MFGQPKMVLGIDNSPSCAAAVAGATVTCAAFVEAVGFGAGGVEEVRAPPLPVVHRLFISMDSSV